MRLATGWSNAGCEPTTRLSSDRVRARRAHSNTHHSLPARTESVIARSVTIAALLALGAAPARAQDAERTAVLATVQKVFDAMRTRDTALLLQAFDSSGRLVGVSTRNGPPTV